MHNLDVTTANVINLYITEDYGVYIYILVLNRDFPVCAHQRAEEEKKEIFTSTGHQSLPMRQITVTSMREFMLSLQKINDNDLNTRGGMILK